MTWELDIGVRIAGFEAKRSLASDSTPVATISRSRGDLRQDAGGHHDLAHHRREGGHNVTIFTNRGCYSNWGRIYAVGPAS